MKKMALKKLLLGSLIALQFANELSGNEPISNVYAQTENQDLILFDEDGKILQLVGIMVGNWEYVTFGYIYRKDSNLYLKDTRDDRIYSITNLDQNYIKIKLVYTKAVNVLSDELKSTLGITKEEAEEISDKFSIGEKTIFITPVDETFPFTYDTFEASGFDNTDLSVSNARGFSSDHISDVFFSWTSTDDYDETKQNVDISNQYQLGICQNTDTYPYYSNIYAEKPIGETDKMGIITCYYVFDDNSERIATLRTQEQVDTFIEANADNIDKYTWKAAFYNGTNIKQILDNIYSNIPISSNNTTYFIDNPSDKEKVFRNND